VHVNTSFILPLLYKLTWPARKLRDFSTQTISWRVVGGLALLAAIWFGGPLIAIGDARPLESERNRIITISIIVLLWVLFRITNMVRARRMNSGFFTSLRGGSGSSANAGQSTSKSEGEAATSATKAADSVVKDRFASALGVLKGAQFGSAPTLSQKILGIGSKRYIYQMPWYMFVGAPGAGKTTALLNSGLNFPLSDKLGQDPLRGVAGTRNCDWWFSDSAVMIDTAGRYTTQDSDQSADAAEWTEFLQLLKRFRPRQPINGVLVTVSLADLLMLGSADRERQANAVRARIQELMQTLNSDFPIYVLISKTDLIAGFTEFFDNLDRTARDQVWGFTFPLDTETDKPDLRRSVLTGEAVAQQFDLLAKRINELSLERLNEERDVARRAMIFGFPYQFQALRDPLVDFLDRALGANKLTRTAMVRGVYFTSGTQEGSPIDRVLGSISRSFGFQRQALAPLRPTGKAFFLRQTLHEIVFPEAVLAGTNLGWAKRFRRIKWSVAIGSAAIASALLIGMGISFFKNRQYIDAVAVKVAQLKSELALAPDTPRALKDLLPVYQTVVNLPIEPNVDPEKSTLWQSFGLFQGPKLRQAADLSYQRLLRDTFAVQLSSRIEQNLRATSSTPELRYETLKTYLMLHNPDRMDAAAFKGWVAFDLEVSQGNLLSPEERVVVLKHVDALLERNVLQGNLAYDDKVVAMVREEQLRTPFPQRVYQRLKRTGVSQDIPDFRIVASGGPSSALVFARVSGKSLNEGMPALYTYDGYYKGFSKALDESLKDLAEEEVWVLGLRDSENAKRVKEIKGRELLSNEVKRLYLEDYANLWEKFIADITVIKGNNLSQTIQTARLMSTPDSPLARLLRAIVREVTLADKFDAVAGVKGKANEVVDDTKKSLMRMLGGPNTNIPSPRALNQQANAPIEVLVDDRFVALRALVRSPGPNQPAPLDQSLTLVNDLYTLMNAAETAAKSGATPPQSEVPARVKAEAGKLPEPLRTILNSLAASGSAQAMGATRINLNQAMQAGVSEFCNKAIGGRYPFSPGSPRDVTPEDFARLFGPAGLMDDFFQKNLAQFVDMSTKPWKFRKVGDAQFNDASGALVQFQRAAEIRSVFFGAGSRGPAMRLDLKPLEMDQAILNVNIDIDGQVVKYAHGPAVSQSIQWPGPRGSNQVRLQISPPGANASGLFYEGPWALFRMFEKAAIEGASVPERFKATFVIDAKKIQFEVTASSVQNPFRLAELQAFKCPSAL
jgi:type VI secretion system protein ImpL